MAYDRVDFGLSLESLQRVRAMMTRAERAVEDKALRQDLRAAAKAQLPRARALTREDTGDLRRSLAVRATKRRRGVFGVQLLYLADRLQLRPGGLNYAIPQEFGVKKGPRQSTGTGALATSFRELLSSNIGTIKGKLRARLSRGGGAPA